MKIKSLSLGLFILSTLIALANCAGQRGPDKVVKTSASLSHFAQVDTCAPTLAWRAVSLPDSPVVTYDVSVHNAKRVKGKNYDRGAQVFYTENVPVTSVKINPPLSQSSAYFWSVRVRKLDGKVSQWSTASKSVVNPPSVANYSEHWHGFQTPAQCW